MPERTDSSFASDFRKFFGRGLAILLPSVLTLWILFQLGAFLFQNVAEPINGGLRRIVLWSAPKLADEDKLPDFMVVTDEEFQRELARRDLAPEEQTDSRLASIRREALRAQFGEFWRLHWYLQGTGLLVAVLVIYLAGLLLGNYLGRSVYNRAEKLISQIPGFKQIYPHVKQVVDMIFGESALKAFSEVVLVQYPKEGVWTVGLVSSGSFQQIAEFTQREMITVFIPTSPTPMTGFVINVPRDEARKLDMTIDQAIRFVITAGVLTPEGDGKPVAIAKGQLIATEKSTENAGNGPESANSPNIN